MQSCNDDKVPALLVSRFALQAAARMRTTTAACFLFVLAVGLHAQVEAARNTVGGKLTDVSPIVSTVSCGRAQRA